MTPYARDLVDYIDQHLGCGQMGAVFYLDEHLSPNWQEHTEQPHANDSGHSVELDFDE